MREVQVDINRLVQIIGAKEVELDMYREKTQELTKNLEAAEEIIQKHKKKEKK